MSDSTCIVVAEAEYQQADMNVFGFPAMLVVWVHDFTSSLIARYYVRAADMSDLME